ncbi:MAG: alpha/beta hydrolase fold protein [Acidimicrobiaceae bacterium]|nr:MAG: alpha/beta hydrolase fold protein [Acidimicrobiaceae bacterium]
MLLDVGDSLLYIRDIPGTGVPIVFVHGSWDDHRSWSACADQLAGHHRVVSYDRRGHTASTAPDRQGSIADDVADLVAVLDHIGVPAVLVGHSYGATVCLLTALDHPALVVGAVVHEPPLFATLKGHPQYGPLLESVGASMTEAARLIEGGRAEEGAELFVNEVAFGPGAWANTFDGNHRSTMISNAATWLDQYRDPNRLALSPARLADATRPLLITRGTASPPIYGPSLDIALAGAPRVASTFINGAGHAAPLTHSDDLVRAITAFINGLDD